MEKSPETPAATESPRSTSSGVLTRIPFHECLDVELLRLKSAGGDGALLIVQINRLAAIAEGMGMQASERVLAVLSERFSTAAPAGALIGKLTTDEFAMFVTPGGEDRAVVVAWKLQEQMAAPIQIEDRRLWVTATTGISLTPVDGATPDDLIGKARSALRRAKTDGVGLRFFKPALHDGLESRFKIESDLRHAIDRGRLTLEFQPICRLSAASRVEGAEALVRWRTASGEMASPSVFVAAAEETGLILALDRWVLTAAVRQASRWARQGWDGFITVNISPRSLHDMDFGQRVRDILDEFHVNPARLVLEITERVLADPVTTRDIFASLREMGMRIAVDDFGTGYSSLVYLQEFPLDFLKVDHQFIRRIGQPGKGEAIARTVIDLSRNLGVAALAEGIETEEQRDWLKKAGCEFGQGYLLGRPGSPANFPIA